MKKIFYFTREVSEWVEVIRRLEIKKKWKPVLIVAKKSLHSSINSTLSDIELIDLFSHRRGEFTKDIYSNEIIIDKNIINMYINAEKIVIAMMNRMDPSSHNFNYHQRIQLYYRILIFWISKFDKYRPDTVLFEETPHLPFDYIMYEVAIKYNCKVIRLQPTHINNRLILFGNIKGTPSYIKNLYIELNNKKNKDLLSKDIKEYYLKLNKNYKEAEPFYMKKQNIDLNKKVSFLFNILSRIFKNKSSSSYYRTKDSYFEYYKSKKYIKSFYFLKAVIYKRKLLNKYNQLINKNIDLSRKYIYVPLHYQPEKTTSPEGDIYENQWLMIQLLSKTLPNGWKIYVKEHKSQFKKNLEGEMGRNIEFYKELLLFDGVELVPLDYNPFDLIDNSQFVATVTGTVGLESIARGKRVLVFGFPWYKISEGVTTIINIEDLKYFYKNTLNKSISQHKVKVFFKLIDKISLPGNNNREHSNFDKQTNIENILQLIDMYEDKI